MKAIVVEQAGPPEVLELRDIPRPQVKPGWVLVRVKAFGLNRSELYTRQGHSGPAVKFPRVLGIECVGVVEEASDSASCPARPLPQSWAEWGAISTAVTPSMRCCRRGR